MINHASSHVEWEPAQNTSSFKTFLAKVGEDDKYQLIVRYPNIIDIIEGEHTNASSLASILSSNMRFLLKSMANETTTSTKQRVFLS